MNPYLVPVNIHCVIDNNPRTDLDAVSRAWKAGEGVWVLSRDADHNRASPAAIQLSNTYLELEEVILRAKYNLIMHSLRRGTWSLKFRCAIWDLI